MKNLSELAGGSTYDRPVISEAQARIDKDITAYLLLVQDLRGQRNRLSPVFRLPLEILAVIFIHGARDHYEDSQHNTSRIPSWVNISYVCRHWRDVALNCPILWSYHFTVSLRWTKELLARSKSASLKLRIFSHSLTDEPWLSTIVKELLNHVERIQELQLHLMGMHLKDVELQANGTLLSLRQPSVDWGAPALRILELSECVFPWQSLALSRLTTLSLDRIPLRFRQNIVEFLALLSGMQDLTALHLEDALTCARDFLSSNASNALSKIDLPHLDRLLVVAPYWTVVALLSHVTIPSKTEIRLTFQTERGPSGDDYAFIPQFLSERFSTFEDSMSIRSLVIDSSPSGLIFVFGASERYTSPDLPGSHEEWGCGVPLSIVIVDSEPEFLDYWDHRPCLSLHTLDKHSESSHHQSALRLI